jgi:hypothetical protein
VSPTQTASTTAAAAEVVGGSSPGRHVLRLAGGAPSGSEGDTSDEEGEAGPGASPGAGAWRAALRGRGAGAAAPGALVATTVGGDDSSGGRGGLSFKERLARVRRAGLLAQAPSSSDEEEGEGPKPAAAAAGEQQQQQLGSNTASAGERSYQTGAAVGVPNSSGDWDTAVEAAAAAGQQVVWAYLTTAAEAGAGTTARVSVGGAQQWQADQHMAEGGPGSAPCVCGNAELTTRPQACPFCPP